MSVEFPELVRTDRSSATEVVFHRSYQRDVSRRLGQLQGVSVEILSTVSHAGSSYPLYLIKSPARATPQLPTVLISGGVHGNEPAGVHAVIDFLEAHSKEKHPRVNVLALPCVNPSGYEIAKLESISGANLNRQFGCHSVEPEVAAIERWLAEQNMRFRATLDLHEAPPDYVGEGFVQSDNPRGCYLYETVTADLPRIGRNLIDALPSDIEVCQWPKIYLDDNLNGVISYPDASHNLVYQEETTLDAYLQNRYTSHSFTTETPTGWPVEKRVKTHLIWVQQALTLIAES